MALHGRQTRCQNGGAHQPRQIHSHTFVSQPTDTDHLSPRTKRTRCGLQRENYQDGDLPDEHESRLLVDGDAITEVQKMDEWLKKNRNDDLLCGIDLDDAEMSNFVATKAHSLVLDLEMEENTQDGQLNVLEFREPDKNNTLMTPQELESMPERGLEFEESVGPKELTQKVVEEMKTDDVFEELSDEVEKKTMTTISVTKFIITSANGTTIQPITLDNLVLSPQNAISLLNNDANGGKFVSLNLIQNEESGQDQFSALQEVDLSGQAKGKRWKCAKEGCDRVYAKKGKLKVHMMSHCGDRPFKCDIDGCDWAFATSYKMRRHRETHEGKKEYECPKDDCPKRFTTIYNLNTHKKLHLRPNTIRCPVANCGKMFPVRRLMEQHMKDHGDNPAPYKCPVQGCGKEYYSPNSMSTHMRVHQKIDLTCSYEGCGKKFDKACRLKQHLRQHTGERPYVCPAEDCNWTFVNASKLTRHMRKHTGDRRHVCPEEGCGKSFMRSEHLQGHMVVHSKSKPFHCEICKTRFSAKSSLYVHLKKHKEDVEKVIYPCPIDMCNKRYTCKSSLRLHMFKFHPLVLAENHLDCITLFANEEIQGITMRDIAASGSTGVAVSGGRLTGEIAHRVGSKPEFLLVSDVSATPNFITSATFQQGDILSQVSEGGGIITQYVTDDDEDRGFANTMVLKSDLHVANEAASAELELAAPRLLQENRSGSARTDFCSNHVNRNKRRQVDADDQLIIPSTVALTDSDVVLTTAIAFGHPSMNAQFVQSNLLQDDSLNVDTFHDDNLLVPITANSLLSESTNVDFKDLE
uniref:C2H2-type domain-containing protein n=1 Tax=Strigamia maritima TaxID=126957 RepID=T1JGY0_STRMM